MTRVGTTRSDACINNTEEAGGHFHISVQIDLRNSIQTVEQNLDVAVKGIQFRIVSSSARMEQQVDQAMSRQIVYLWLYKKCSYLTPSTNTVS